MSKKNALVEQQIPELVILDDDENDEQDEDDYPCTSEPKDSVDGIDITTEILKIVLGFIISSTIPAIYKFVIYGGFGRWLHEQKSKIKGRSVFKLNIKKFTKSNKHGDIDLLTDNPDKLTTDLGNHLRRHFRDRVNISIQPKSDSTGYTIYINGKRIVDTAKADFTLITPEIIAKSSNGQLQTLSFVELFNDSIKFAETYENSPKPKYLTNKSDFYANFETRVKTLISKVPDELPVFRKIININNDLTKPKNDCICVIKTGEYPMKSDDGDDRLMTCESSILPFITTQSAINYLTKAEIKHIKSTFEGFESTPGTVAVFQDRETWISEGQKKGTVTNTNKDKREVGRYVVFGINERSQVYRKMGGSMYAHLRSPSKVKCTRTPFGDIPNVGYNHCRAVAKLLDHLKTKRDNDHFSNYTGSLFEPTKYSELDDVILPVYYVVQIMELVIKRATKKKKLKQLIFEVNDNDFIAYGDDIELTTS
jgi:hypothetical protein